MQMIDPHLHVESRDRDELAGKFEPGSQTCPDPVLQSTQLGWLQPRGRF